MAIGRAVCFAGTDPGTNDKDHDNQAPKRRKATLETTRTTRGMDEKSVHIVQGTVEFEVTRDTSVRSRNVPLKTKVRL